MELGCQITTLGFDNEIISVTHRDRRFDALRLAVRDGDLELRDLDVVYLDGPAEEIALGTVLRRGDRTIPLLLRGRDHSIDRVEVLYRVVSNYPGRLATVCLEGRNARVWADQEPCAREGRDPRACDGWASRAGDSWEPLASDGWEPLAGDGWEPRAGDGWEPLAGDGWEPRAGDGWGVRARDAWEQFGCSDIALSANARGNLFTGRHDGVYQAVRLRVLGAELDLVSLGVRYTDGRIDEIALSATVREGEYTRPFNLQRRGGAISRIDLLYRPLRSVARRATVCVEGMW
jgi:hypothetical protein